MTDPLSPAPELSATGTVTIYGQACKRYTANLDEIARSLPPDVARRVLQQAIDNLPESETP